MAGPRQAREGIFNQGMLSVRNFFTALSKSLSEEVIPASVSLTHTCSGGVCCGVHSKLCL